MAALTLAVAISLAACNPAPRMLSAAEFGARCHDLLARRDYAAAQKLIAERERGLPDDPEAIIARANLYFRQCTGPVALRGPQARPVAAGDTVMFDTLLARRALETLSDGVRRHPGRLDMRVGLVYLFQEMGIRIGEAQLFQETVDYARQHPDSLLWTYGGPLPERPDVFIPQTLDKYVEYYAKRGAPGDDQAMVVLAQILMRAYPHSPIAATQVASYFGAHEQWDKSLEYLRLAERADSTDALVLYNIGLAHEQLKQPAPAIAYYRRAIVSGVAGGHADVVDMAQHRLLIHGITP